MWFRASVALLLWSGIISTSRLAFGQTVDIGQLLTDLTVVEKEEAAAKKVRLEWISEERGRIRNELQQYQQELKTLQEMQPDPVKPRVLPESQLRRRAQDEASFNLWANENSTDRRAAVLRGPALNALLKVLGPIAHCRRQRATNDSLASFPSLAQSEWISAEESRHYHLNPPTSGGNKMSVRLNQLPLELEFQTVLRQYWDADCRAVQKLRDEYLGVLASGPQRDPKELADCWEAFDGGMALLQAKAVKKQTEVTRSQSQANRILIFTELRDAIRYLEQLRATAARFKTVPGDYKVREFPGGSVEELLDFCYVHGFALQPAQAADEEAYVGLYRKMQSYSRDLQYVEDWKEDLRQRMEELDRRDQNLVWHAAAQ